MANEHRHGGSAALLRTQVCLYVPILVALFMTNFFWLGREDPRKGFPLPYAWFHNGREHVEQWVLVVNGIACVGFAAVLSWGLPRIVMRRPLSITPIHAGQPVHPGRLIAAAAWAILGPVIGLLLGAVWSWSFLGGVLNLVGIIGCAQISAEASLAWGFLGALLGLPIGFIAAWLLLFRLSGDL